MFAIQHEIIENGRTCKEQEMVIRDLEQITPAWLSDVLGVPVESVSIESSQPFGAVIAHLTLTYGDLAPEDAPERLFFKMSDGQDGVREVRFYQAVKAGGLDVPLPKMYDAAYTDRAFHLLMDDLSVTHQTADQEIPPYVWQCEAAIDALAQLHARWRGDVEFLRAMHKYPLHETGWTFDMNMAPVYAEFADWLGERLPARTQAIYEGVIGALPRLSERYQDPSRLTLIHGDAHFWNFLYPKEPEAHPACLIDWEALDVGTGLEDVAYGMVLFWTAERRARLEKGLVERYHRGLIESGVDDYQWAQCWDDYRLAAIQCLFNCLWWWKHGMPAYLWWPRLERAAAAYDDLRCYEFAG